MARHFVFYAMNFLAHLVLSHRDPERQMGNFLGDFTKGKPPLHYPEGIRAGIRQHRLIDATTDAHPATRRMVTHLRPRHGRYAGVVADVIFDLYLYRNWTRFVEESYSDFREVTYANLSSYLPLVADPPRPLLSRMIEHDFLAAYQSRAGILGVFERLRPRLSKPEALDRVEVSMEVLDETFNDCFLWLFPDLIRTINLSREQPH